MVHGLEVVYWAILIHDQMILNFISDINFTVLCFSSFQSLLVFTWQLESQKKLCVFYRGLLKKIIKNFLPEN